MRLLLAGVAALVLLATPGVVMAQSVTPVSVTLGGHDGATCGYAYNPQTDVITTVQLANTDNVAHTITGAILNPSTLAVVAQGSEVMLPNSSQMIDVSVFGVLMVDHIAKDGVTHYLAPSVLLSCAIS